ncbi:cytotoxic translational repressor of toxin-antitoxin stability system [Desulfomonile tiedjei DSM 6799]|uniref:Cytotoxic translational repressor of toxin-antitoxin stability system n=1 Tax=Desulfomonile tiedjei (strain ATCC 49306 / DSM 6799 / DCB-1) TaxID=706587 RepID=I4BZM6_DESTA|nr:cytotoxic translational repressor of toxin-antitoxin stability system [Desulfomonile tiedjei DSM 6799]
MSYIIQILGPAKRSLRKFQKHEQSVARELIEPLKNDPRPSGCDNVMGHKNILRVKHQDIRVIYGVADDIRHVFIIDVRRRNEATYKNIPIQTLDLAISEAISTLKARSRDD